MPIANHPGLDAVTRSEVITRDSDDASIIADKTDAHQRVNGFVRAGMIFSHAIKKISPPIDLPVRVAQRAWRSQWLRLRVELLDIKTLIGEI